MQKRIMGKLKIQNNIPADIKQQHNAELSRKTNDERGKNW